MALSGALSVFNLVNFQFRLMPASDVFAMKPASLYIEVSKRFFIPCCLVRLKIQNSEKIIPFVKQKEIKSMEVIFDRRGIAKISEVFVSSSFPFLFFVRSIRVPTDFEVVVFPQPIASDYLKYFSEGQRDTESRVPKGKSYEGEIIGVRAYSPQDPLKYIHWKATAKSSQLMTKEFSPYRGNPVIVDINDFSGDLEQKIGKATYALLNISQRGIPVGLKLDSTIYKPEVGNAHLRRLLNALALY